MVAKWRSFKAPCLVLGEKEGLDGALGGSLTLRTSEELWAARFLIPREKWLTFSGLNGNPTAKH